MKEKIEKLADALDWDASNVTLETHLDTLQWDSMAMLTVVALARANGKIVKGEDLRKMVTVADVIAAI